VHVLASAAIVVSINWDTVAPQVKKGMLQKYCIGRAIGIYMQLQILDLEQQAACQQTRHMIVLQQCNHVVRWGVLSC
jgi:hypothetical protein